MNDSVLKQALNHWGPAAQMAQCNEELAELQVALSHFRRGKATREDVAQEVADVLIMAGQMRLAFGPHLVDEAIDNKLIRLQRTMGAQ